MASQTRTERLAHWAASLKFKDIPQDAVRRTEELFLDWLGCAIAGRSHPAVAAISRFSAKMGPTSGKCDLVDASHGVKSSPAFASMINAAASHVVEQDDLHMSSITHPVRSDLCSLRATDTPGNCDLPRGSGRCAGRRGQW